MSADIQYKVPRLNTINLELRDFDSYIDEKFDSEKLELDFNFDLRLKKSKTIEIFIHLRYLYYDDDADEHFPLYHSDHTVVFELKKLKKKPRLFRIDFLAHILGTSIIMIKGCYDHVTRGYTINEYPLPVFKPLELIKVKYEDDIENNLLNFDLEKRSS